MFLFFLGVEVLAQTESRNPIPTAIPFLRITPDAIAAGVGEQGIATPADVFSQQWNPAKYIYSEYSSGIGISYTPYLSKLVDDIFLGNATFFGRINDRSIWAGSLRYFSLGEIEKTALIGGGIVQQGVERPNELSIDITYALELGTPFSLAVTGRYIRSDLRLNLDGYPRGAQTVGADISGFHQGKWIQKRLIRTMWRYGFRISNLGPKLNYEGRNSRSYFIPTNLGVGGGLDLGFDAENVVGIYVELNKLLVPTPSEWTSEGYVQPEIGFLEGLFTSFTDAPGGLREEINEVSISLGISYRFMEKFIIRGGYFGESKIKGPRRYLTLGTGIKSKSLGLDLSYLFSTSSIATPLDNTLRISASWHWNQ